MGVFRGPHCLARREAPAAHTHPAGAPTRQEAAAAAHAELPPHLKANIPLSRYLAWVERLQAPPPFVLEDEVERLWRRQPATEAQLALLAAHGYDVQDTSWTKGDASEVIEGLEPTPRQKARLLALGYDTLTRRWTRRQAQQVFREAEARGVQPDWNRVRGLAPHWLS